MRDLFPGTAAGVARAVAILAAGGIVAIPTDTVYGLAADATRADAVAKVYAAKGRPDAKPLIAHVADLAMAETLASFDAVAHALARRFWPGPLTLVLPARADCPVCDAARGGIATIAVRAPAHPLALAVIAALGRPLAAPSANVSGEPAPTRADEIDLAVAILDGGPTPLGIASTIVAVADGRLTLLRAGSISAHALGIG